MKIAIVLGNGFDLDLGLKTRYSDFMNSKEWGEIVKQYETSLLSEVYCNCSLIKYLIDAKESANWFDLEEEIHKFVQLHVEDDEKAISSIRCEFEDIRSALKKYLKIIVENLEVDNTKLSNKLFGEIFRLKIPTSIINFNYTNYINSKKFHPLALTYFSYNFTYIHEALAGNDLILGCDLQDNEPVNRQLSFMYKYNMRSETNNVAYKLLEADEVIFFGHSINVMDFHNFKTFFKATTRILQPRTHLTIFTYDKESERCIKDNIQSQGISVTELYNNLATFTFIHTKDFYDNVKEERQNYEDLIYRLSKEEKEDSQG